LNNELAPEERLLVRGSTEFKKDQVVPKKAERTTYEGGPMNNNKLMALIAGFTLIVAGAAGCDTASNTNSYANTNANLAATNSNMNANANANMNANSSRRSVNANITREEYERDKDSFTEDAKRLGRTIGTGANDGWLWTKTRALLAAADDLRDSTIDVDVDNEVVTLSGTVATPAQKNRAAQVARGVEGVKNVRNNLVVRS
jgi:hyperosmotically inducible protein